MKRIKKELLAVILIVIAGICFTILATWNAERYDKTHPVQKVSSYYEYELSHHN